MLCASQAQACGPHSQAGAGAEAGDRMSRPSCVLRKAQETQA